MYIETKKKTIYIFIFALKLHWFCWRRRRYLKPSIKKEEKTNVVGKKMINLQ
jgi:hypothetical protein